MTEIVIYFTFMLIFYMIPLGFSSWIIPDEFERMIFTTVNPDEIWPLSWFLTYNLEYKGIMHTFFGFRTCYILCLWFSSALVTLVVDVINASKS